MIAPPFCVHTRTTGSVRSAVAAACSAWVRVMYECSRKRHHGTPDDLEMLCLCEGYVLGLHSYCPTTYVELTPCIRGRTIQTPAASTTMAAATHTSQTHVSEHDAQSEHTHAMPTPAEECASAWGSSYPQLLPVIFTRDSYTVLTSCITVATVETSAMPP